MQRLDKVLADADVASRSEIKIWIRRGRVTVDGVAVVKPETKVDDGAVLAVDGVAVVRKRRFVAMLHKPAGYVTSVKDKDPTVMELVPEAWRRMDLMPVGRLDKDTEGLLVMTNDGALAHALIAPKHGIPKVYVAEHEGQAEEKDVEAFRKGVFLKEDGRCLPAVLKPLGPGRSEIIIQEGKYHQVRRMMAAVGLPVTYLKRVREGALELGDLPRGAMRELTPQEEAKLFDRSLLAD